MYLSRKKTGSSSRNALIQEEAIDPPNRPENGEYLMIRRTNEQLDGEPVLRNIFKTR